MKRLFPVLLLLIFVFAACGGASIPGKYYHEDDDGSYIELKKDGSVWIGYDEGEAFEYGTYETNKNNVTISIAGMTVMEGSVSGKKLTLNIIDESETEVFYRR